MMTSLGRKEDKYYKEIKKNSLMMTSLGRKEDEYYKEIFKQQSIQMNNSLALASHSSAVIKQHLEWELTYLRNMEPMAKGLIS